MVKIERLHYSILEMEHDNVGHIEIRDSFSLVDLEALNLRDIKSSKGRKEIKQITLVKKTTLL